MARFVPRDRSFGPPLNGIKIPKETTSRSGGGWWMLVGDPQRFHYSHHYSHHYSPLFTTIVTIVTIVTTDWLEMFGTFMWFFHSVGKDQGSSSQLTKSGLKPPTSIKKVFSYVFLTKERSHIVWHCIFLVGCLTFDIGWRNWEAVKNPLAYIHSCMYACI